MNTCDRSILVTTLGASWAVVPESLAALDGDACPLLQHSAHLAGFQDRMGGAGVKELWLVTSSGAAPAQGLAAIRQWVDVLRAPPILRCWQLAGSDNMDSEDELAAMRELILRLVLLANEQGTTTISLAGGRKTMSADMQYAASLLGCAGLFHVVVKDPSLLPSMSHPAAWAQPLAANVAGQVVPAYIGSYAPSELLHVGPEGAAPVSTAEFPLPLAPAGGDSLTWACQACSLSTELQRRQRDGARLTHNFLRQLAGSGHHGTFRHLYRLPPLAIEQLRSTSISEASLGWLQQLPKAELHCHLGGLLNLPAQRRCAEAIWLSLSEASQQATLILLRRLQDESPDWLPALRDVSFEQRPELVAAVFHTEDDAAIQALLFGDAPRIALGLSAGGFAAYERPGELTGSAVLGHPAALAPYVQAVREYANADNLHYLELRGSPHKYSRDPVGWVRQFRDCLTDNRVRLIWVVDRRDPDRAAQCVAWAVEAYESLDGFVVGLDLAGDEGETPAADLQDAFSAAFAVCMPLTIHAGEGQPSQQIWEAAYRLHADRVGHGLTLNDDARLRERFRNRGISVECCPTSNREVVGFYDSAIDATQGFPPHPWRDLWDAGVSVSLNTDNPGISQTTLSAEYLAAARMHPKGMSHWEALGLVRQGFVRGMLPAAEREALVKSVDSDIFLQLSAIK